jgi:cell wall-associated NlpC family hydrolase
VKPVQCPIDYSDLLFVPFEWRGRLAPGLDCYGLMLEVYRRLGFEIEMPDFEYGPDWPDKDPTLIIRHATMNWRPIVASRFGDEMGDVAMFRFREVSDSHIGTWIGNGFIHTSRASGVSVGRWDRFSGLASNFFRWIGHGR